MKMYIILLITVSLFLLLDKGISLCEGFMPLFGPLRDMETSTLQLWNDFYSESIFKSSTELRDLYNIIQQNCDAKTSTESFIIIKNNLILLLPYEQLTDYASVNFLYEEAYRFFTWIRLFYVRSCNFLKNKIQKLDIKHAQKC